MRFVLLPAEKGGLRTRVVSGWVGGLCVICSLVDLSLNFTMVMGSFNQKHVLILIGQSEIREVVWAHSY